METWLLGVIIALIILLVLLIILYVLKKRGCSLFQPTVHDPSIYSLGGPRSPSRRSNSSRESQCRQQPFVQQVDATTTWNSSRQFTEYRVENERSRPTPYVISNNYGYDQPSSNSHTPPAPNWTTTQRTYADITGAQQQQRLSVGGHGHATGKAQRPRGGRATRKTQQPQRTIVTETKVLDNVANDINEMIQKLQTNLPQDKSPNKSESIDGVQRLLLLCPLTTLAHTAEDCTLVIGVDATPATLAGYCVNLKEKKLEYYVIKRNKLPWVLRADKDPSEFEMKNFMFALVVWKGLILKYKRMAIYTDNFAITGAKQFDASNYGKRAFKLLMHYAKCERVAVVNINNMATNKNKKLKQFATYLQPADDLSRWKIGRAIEFLTELYGIDQENINGTHYLNSNGRASAQAPYYKPTERHQEILELANEIIYCHDCPNPACSGADLLQASLRIKK